MPINNSSVSEYWSGQGIDYDETWKNFELGKKEYLNKFQMNENIFIKFSFKSPTINYPLFDLESKLKTIKGFSYEISKACFTDDEYNFISPIYLYAIERGSTDWILIVNRVLGDLIVRAINIYYEYKKNKIELDKLKLENEKIKISLESDKLEVFIKFSKVLNQLGADLEKLERLKKFISNIPEGLDVALEHIIRDLKSISLIEETKTPYGNLPDLTVNPESTEDPSDNSTSRKSPNKPKNSNKKR